MIEKKMYSKLKNLHVEGFNATATKSHREWDATSTGAARGEGRQTMIEVTEVTEEGKMQRRWINLETFTGHVGRYEFKEGVRVDDEKSDTPAIQ